MLRMLSTDAPHGTSTGPARLPPHLTPCPEAHSEVLTVSGVLQLGGPHGRAICCGCSGGRTVGLGFTDQCRKGVIWVHHLQRLQREGVQGHTTSCILRHAEPFCGKKALGRCLRFRKTSAHTCTQHPHTWAGAQREALTVADESSSWV